MTLRQYLTIMTAGTILCWISWILVLFNVDPFTSGVSGFLFFYLTLFLALLGTVSIISYVVRSYVSDALTPMFRHVKKSFRDGAFGASAAILALSLMSTGLLRLWNLGLFAVIVLFVILFIVSARRTKTGVAGLQ